mgnify:CR=1
MSTIDNFKINLNQNLWVLVISLLGLGIAEYFNLPILLNISCFLSIISTSSVLFTLFFYTFNYCKAKIK